MVSVNMLEAKTTLSKLVERTEGGLETEIGLARNGKPAARLVPLASTKRSCLVGIAKSMINFDKTTFDSVDDEMADLFGIPAMEDLPRP